jgi:Cd2+/Zn2+-exporting ATPase
MSNLSYKVYGLDCIEEVRIIKEALSSTVDDNDLSFDLLNGKLTIQNPSNKYTQETIEPLFKKTGMRTIPWENYITNTQKDGFFAAHGRLISTSLGALFLIIGFLNHAWFHDFYDALAGSDKSFESLHQYPPMTIILYIISIISGGWYVFPKALAAVRRLSADMNLLMVVAVVGAASINQWLEAASVTTLFSLALLLESWSIGKARKAIQRLMQLTPDKAHVYCCSHKSFEAKELDEVSVGSTILVKPGEKIPLDGEVLKGEPYINEAPITGESLSVCKQEGDMVYAGSINGNTRFEFKSTKLATDTTLARIITMIQEAQSKRAKSERWVEKFARYYTPIMMCLAILIAVLPPLILGQGWTQWFYEGLVILVIACPCALVISTPVSIVAGLNAAARNGILVKGGNYLEIPASIKAIAFDKTGTLTKGQPVIQRIIALNGHSEEQLLGIAASLEANTDHPLAQAILAKAEQQAINFTHAEKFKVIEGKGAEGTIDGEYYWIGSHRFLHELFPNNENERVHNAALNLEDEGHSLVIIGTKEHVCGVISIADELKLEAPNVVQELHDLHIKHVTMLTGDNNGTAQAIANKLKLNDYFSELLPEDKVTKIKELKHKFEKVAMVGDGINDAPAMATSSLAIAMGAMGSDAAIETADIALMTDDIKQIPRLIKHSKRVLHIIKQNISFSLAIKLVFIILAMLDMATLWIAIAADMGASLLVIFNALRLLKMKEK